MKIGRRGFLAGLTATVAALTAPSILTGANAAPVFIPKERLGMGVPHALKPAAPEIIRPTFDQIVEIGASRTMEAVGRAVSDGIERGIRQGTTGYLYGAGGGSWVMENVQIQTYSPEEQERRNRAWLNQFEAEWDKLTPGDAKILPSTQLVRGNRQIRLNKFGPLRRWEWDVGDPRPHGEIIEADGTVHKIEMDSMSPMFEED